MFKKKNSLDSSEYIVFGKKNNILEDAYTRLKDNIICYGVDNNKKVIQIESAVKGEGKTTVAVNLAIALGESSKKVLIIDLDFRRPKIHRPFKIENQNGLADYMVDRCKKEEIIKETGFKNVNIINRGCEIANSSVILTSQKLRNLLEELKKEYDFIILDCPPVLLISDYIHISRLSDGILFIIAFAISKKKEVKESFKLLNQNNVDVIGTVFTHYDRKKTLFNKNDKSLYYGYKTTNEEEN